MPIAPGTRLGPYEITAPLGAGGMGEVYRARDSRLNRDVAIKTLPAAFVDDPGRMARFQREAQLLAALSHPNIAAIYGLEESGGVRALVMELVEGPTLAERIAASAIPLDEALAIARQIADALDAAHEKGIIHRDLKPANIKVTPEGKVKVLDFGLAKAFETEQAADPSLSPTLTLDSTRAGVILGTAGYMSPEQARGKRAGKRADIWAFGVVLFEMLAGHKAFAGETISDTLASVLKTDPDWSRLPAATPPRVRRLLRRCLERDPGKRLRDIGDAWIEMDAPEETPASPGRPRIWIALAAISLLAAIALAVIHFRETPPETPVVRSTILPPDKTVFGAPGTTPFGSGAPVLSPDGRRLAFPATSSPGKSAIWVRSLDALTAQPLAGSEGGTFPFWSPDGKSLGFFADDKLKRIDASGGPPLTLCAARNGLGGTWNREGTIVFSTFSGTLLRVSAAGGLPSPATATDQSQHEGIHVFPWFLPDGRHFLYTSGAPSEYATLLGSIDGPPSPGKLLAGVSSNAVYSAGVLLFVREGTLMARPFSLAGATFTGDAIPLAEQVAMVTNAYAGFSASENGTLVYQHGAVQVIRQLAWFDRAGKQLAPLGEPANFRPFSLSPDGKSVAVGVYEAGAGSQIWILDARGIRSKFTYGKGVDNDPIWSPDGRTIVFASNRKGHRDLYRKNADLSGQEELLYEDNLDKIPTGWSADGKSVIYSAASGGDSSVWVLPIADHPKPIAVTRTSPGMIQAQLSPDGKWIAYSSGESGRTEVYTAAFPGGAGKRQISTNGGVRPHWRRDGGEIFYIAPGGNLMAVQVKATGTSLESGAPVKLFGPIPGIQGNNYDISPDGQRILTLAVPEESFNEPLTLVQNWPASLKK
ncbi:Serine/threonine protein kinase [Candidatus Sulfopaludibacter sp. SbA6]|nr:Serine/threonine protein kinase [Candidatus Sulfopaludibacter sp. SbA6]